MRPTDFRPEVCWLLNGAKPATQTKGTPLSRKRQSRGKLHARKEARIERERERKSSFMLYRGALVLDAPQLWPTQFSRLDLNPVRAAMVLFLSVDCFAAFAHYGHQRDSKIYHLPAASALNESELARQQCRRLLHLKQPVKSSPTEPPPLPNRWQDLSRAGWIYSSSATCLARKI